MRISGVVVGALLLGACGQGTSGTVRKEPATELGQAPEARPEEPAAEAEASACEGMLEFPEALPSAPVVSPAPTAEACGEVAPSFATEGFSSVSAPFGFSEPVACVPVSPSGTRYAHACRVDTYSGCGGWEKTDVLDAQGRAVHSFAPWGEGVTEVIRRFENGHLVREQTLNGGGLRVTTATFSDGGHELEWSERWRNREGTHCTETSRSTTLNTWGAPAETAYRGGDSGTMTFTYDDQRRLIAVDGYLGTRRLHYAEAGWLEAEEETGWYHSSATRYDAQGRTLYVSAAGMGGDSTEELSYGVNGLEHRTYRWNGGSRGTTETVIEYDARGLPVLQWQLTDGELHVGGGEVATAHERVAIRRTFTCAGDLLLEEVDRDQDGLADAHTEYERDGAGNLLSQSTFEGGRRTHFVRHHYTCD